MGAAIRGNKHNEVRTRAKASKRKNSSKATIGVRE
jgi:hypothetical protein